MAPVPSAPRLRASKATENFSGSMSETSTESESQFQEFKDTVCSQAAKITRLERLLEEQSKKLKSETKTCTQDHLPDLAELGARLAVLKASVEAM